MATTIPWPWTWAGTPGSQASPTPAFSGTSPSGQANPGVQFSVTSPAARPDPGVQFIDPLIITGLGVGPTGALLIAVFNRAVVLGSGTWIDGWTLTGEYGAIELTYSGGAGSSVILYNIVRSPVNRLFQGEIVLADYIAPANHILDATSVPLGSFSNRTVTNNSTVEYGGSGGS